MFDTLHVQAIIVMALVTYGTRLAGYALFYNRTLSPRAKVVMETAPGCVLITIIAPQFVTGSIADALAMVITVLAATRFSILPTIAIAILSAAVLRHIIG